MVTREYLREFARFLEEASDAELEKRIKVIEESITRLEVARVSQKPLVADLRFLLRRVREEQAARNEVKALADLRKAS